MIRVVPTSAGDYEPGTACDIAATAYITYTIGAQKYMAIGWVAPSTKADPSQPDMSALLCNDFGMHGWQPDNG